MNKIKNEKIQTQFHTSFRWNIAGSLFYETAKVLHQFFLFKIMTRSSYGLMGSIFGIIYFVIYITKLGIGESLPAYLNIFTANKNNFKKVFLKLYLLPQIFIFIVGALVTSYIYSKSLFNNPESPFFILIPLTIVFEGVRIFFRRFLHTVFINKKTIVIESILMLLFLSAIWIPYLFFNIQISQNLIFIPYLLDSIIAVIAFTILMKNFYKTLPNEQESYPENLLPRILKTRFFNYSIQFGKNFFTGNFLTPFFATVFGLSDAGIFNLANHLAEAIRSTMKVTVIFSGGALLAKLKANTLKVKREAFKLLNNKLNVVVYPILIFLTINYKSITNLKGVAPIPAASIQMILLLLILTFMEYFFLAYEQFYIVEEKTSKMFLFKLIEFSLFYGLILINGFTSPENALMGIIIVRFISFAIISINAYRYWKIRPNFKIKKSLLISSIVISLIFYAFFS